MYRHSGAHLATLIATKGGGHNLMPPCFKVQHVGKPRSRCRRL